MSRRASGRAQGPNQWCQTLIEQVDEQLKSWIREVHGDVALSLDAPRDVDPSTDASADGAPGTGVNLYLLELVESPPLRGPGRSPLQIALRYLVTTWAPEAEKAHNLLGELVFAAMQHEQFEAELHPLPAATWSALGIRPRPSFVLRALLRLEQPAPEVERVLKPLQVQAVPLRSLSGVVLGPDDIPLAGALVEARGYGRRSRTDLQGRFVLTGLPAAEGLETLRVSAKALQLDVPIAPGDEPIVIRFDPLTLEEG